MNTHKEESKDKYIEAREKVLDILIDEYKQNCNFDALMRIMAVVEEYGGTVEPTPPSQIEEEPLRTLVEKWREYNSQQTNEGFDMPVDKSFRGFMEWLGDNTK